MEPLRYPTNSKLRPQEPYTKNLPQMQLLPPAPKTDQGASLGQLSFNGTTVNLPRHIFLGQFRG
ncbi:MAG: hypothetical protein WC860_02470 [Candidatus Margulisiibacteriota bacterium]|jgi:hypothetical protein